jgi:hypothetical protein
MNESGHCLKLQDLRKDEALIALQLEDMLANLGYAVAPQGDAEEPGRSPVIRLVPQPRMAPILVRWEAAA